LEIEEGHSEPGVIPINVLQAREFSGAQRAALAALEEMAAAVQRMRDVVKEATKHKKTAWDRSMWSLELELHQATDRMRKATAGITKLLRA
jgi:hypothetical protein